MMNRMRIHAQVSQEYLNRAIITRGLYILNPLFEGQIDYTFTLNYIQESTGNKHYNFKMEISRIDHCDTTYKADIRHTVEIGKSLQIGFCRLCTCHPLSALAFIVFVFPLTDLRVTQLEQLSLAIYW